MTLLRIQHYQFAERSYNKLAKTLHADDSPLRKKKWNRPYLAVFPVLLSVL